MEVLTAALSKDDYLRLAFATVSGLLFVSANSAWISLGYLDPLAWFLEWSSILLAFFNVYLAVRTKSIGRQLYGYLLILLSLIISGVSFYPALTTQDIQRTIFSSTGPLIYLVFLIPVVILAFQLQSELLKKYNTRIVSLVFFLAVVATMTFVIYSFYRMGPSFPTDESVFDMYAAHLFLSGKNPYDPALMSTAFSFYNFHFTAFDPITPLTTGGYVNSLTYPAMSFLLFIPAVIFHLKASLIVLPTLVAPIVLIWTRAWKRNEWSYASYAILPFLTLLYYEYQGASADTDALWASLLMLSYMFLPRVRGSGILFGLALSVKQLPIFAGPFLLYFIYREHGAKNALLWLGFAILSFFAVNGYFILQNPGYWFSSVITSEFAPLMGIGFGIPQISFTGIIQMPKIYFTIAMAALLIVSFFVYVVKYRHIKYGLFIFPILVFLLNYRLFPQYMYYWLIISLLPMLDLLHTRNGEVAEKETENVIRKHSYIESKKVIAGFLVIVLVGSVVIGYHEGVQKNPGYFSITSVKYTSYNSSGYVKEMEVEISYHGPVQNLSHVNFRIIQDSPVVNGNMYLWLPSNNTIMKSGSTYNMTIYPQYNGYSLDPIESTMIVAYHGDIQGSYYIRSSK